MALHGIAHQPRVGQDHRVNPPGRRLVQRRLPGRGVARLRVSVQRHQHLAPALVRVSQARENGLFIKVQPREIARIGRIAQAQINAIGPLVNRPFERRQTAGRAHQLRRLQLWRGIGIFCGSVFCGFGLRARGFGCLHRGHPPSRLK